MEIFCYQVLNSKVLWAVIPDFCSDYNPILIDISLVFPNPKKPTRTLLSFRKAKWEDVTPQVEEDLASSNLRATERWMRRLESSITLS